MNAQSNDPADPREEPAPPVATPPEQKSDMQNVSAPTDDVDVRAASPEMTPPTEPRIGENEDGQSPPAPNAATRPKKTKTKTENDTGNGTKNNTKNKSQSKPKRAKASKHAGEEPSDAGETGKGTADEGAPIFTCLQGAHIEPATLPPTATLPTKLGTLFPDMMSVSALLAVTAAAAGHGVRLDTGKNGDGSSLAMRIAIVGEERHLPQAVVPVLHGAYALEAQEVQRWKADKMTADLKDAADAVRRRLHQQLAANAGLLGLAELPDSLNFMIVAASSAVPRPCFVLRNPVQTDVRRGLEAANSGVLIVDGRRMPTMSGFGVNYDEVTSSLLNDAAAGRSLELADPRNAGCIRMRPVVVSAIGTLSIVDIFGLHKAGPTGLAATVFVPAEERSNPHPADAVMAATDILVRVRALAANPQDAGSRLRLSAAARKTLEQAEGRMARASAAVLPPLAHYYAAVADLVRRIAVGLHILDHAARQADRISAEIGKDVMLRAIGFVERCVLPAACSVLAPASVAPEVRNARRILSFAQQFASVASPRLAQRDVNRILRRSMSVAEVDRAIGRLLADGLLAASNPDAESGGGHVFQIDLVVFDPANQLPDLVTDPRRPRT